MNFPFISTKKMALIDKLMVEDLDIVVMQMMEIAGLDTALLAKKMCKGKNIAVLCGKGNNGGDGIVASRHLSNFGFICTLIFPFSPSKLRNVPKHQLKSVKKMGIKILNSSSQKKKAHSSISKSNLIIDSLIGYNLKGNPKKEFAELIEFANNSKKKILAVDVPSGLDSTTGKAFSPCIKSNATLALTLPKTGLRKKDGKKFAGKIYVGYLTVPNRVLKKAKIKPRNWFSKNLVEQYFTF